MLTHVVAALNERSWDEYVRQQHGPRIGDLVAATLQPVVGARISEAAADVVPGGSKLGGLPHVDESFRWPTEDDTDESLALVCQLNLADLANTDERRLPKQGMLYLFSIYDCDRADGYEIDAGTAKVIYVPEPGPLTVAERPADLGDDGVFDERPVVLAASLTRCQVDPDGRASKARFQHAVEAAFDELLIAHGGAPANVLRLLGQPYLWRAEMREQVDPQRHTLLLHVDGYFAARYAFGEGSFHVLIDNDDLAAGRLDRTEIVFEPGS